MNKMKHTYFGDGPVVLVTQRHFTGGAVKDFCSWWYAMSWVSISTGLVEVKPNIHEVFAFVPLKTGLANGNCTFTTSPNNVRGRATLGEKKVISKTNSFSSK